MIEVQWDANQTGSQYLVEVETKALNRPGLLNELSRVFSDHRVDIVSGSMASSSDQIATARFTFGLPGVGYLDQVLSALRRVDGVFEASRVLGTAQRKTDE